MFITQKRRDKRARRLDLHQARTIITAITGEACAAAMTAIDYRRAKVLVLLAIGAMPIGSYGADDQPVKAPYIEPGDCWSYHAEGFFFRGWINDYELCVTSVDQKKNLILAVATVKDDGREIDTAFALDWAAH